MAEPERRPRRPSRSDERAESASPRRRRADADEHADRHADDGSEPVRRHRAEQDDGPRRQRATRPTTRKADGSRLDKHDRERSRDSDSESGDRSDGVRPSRRRSTKGIDARRAAAAAAVYVQELTGTEPEGLTSLDHTDDGWRIGVEVLESRRVPDSTDILAEYQVDLDRDGDLVGYRRERRYHRGRVEGDQQ